MSHAREFEKQVRAIARRQHLWQVFTDFCELAALAIHNQRVRFDEDREAKYMQVIGRYEPEEAQAFPALIAITQAVLAEEPQDFLGQMFMSLELGSHWHGQFFTPYHLCAVMAACTLDDDLVAKTARGEVLTIQEPACGAGAMVIALAEEVERRGGNRRFMKVSAVDVDRTAANMAYIQLSMLGIPAAVYTGNTLTLETSDVMVTPAWLEQAFELRARDFDTNRIEAVTEAIPAAIHAADPRGQLALFAEVDR